MQMLFPDERDAGGDPVVEVGVAVGDAELDHGAEPSVEIDLHLIVGRLAFAIESVMGADVAFPKGRWAEEDVGEEGDPSVGQGREEEFRFGAGHIEDEILVVGFAPVVFGAVAPFEGEGAIFIEGPLAASIGVIEDVVPVVPAASDGEIERGDVPGEIEVEAGNDLGNGEVGEEGVGEEVGSEGGTFP